MVCDGVVLLFLLFFVTVFAGKYGTQVGVVGKYGTQVGVGGEN